MDGTVTLAEGTRVAGRYVLVRPLARGSMGQVWIAKHETLEGELAIKFMLPQMPGPDAEDEQTAMARFRFEAQVAAKLARKSRHIVAVTDHGEEGGWAYLVMELVEGESLDAKMRGERQLDLRFVANVAAQIAKGLSAAHAEGVFHRDLKPANILLTKDEDGAVLAKILDFGIAKTVRRHHAAPVEEGGKSGPGHSTEAGIVLGTPNYMSPEQARGLSSLDHRCDIWALSVIVYEALTAHLPYDGETTADLLVNVCTSKSTPARDHREDLPSAIEPFFERAFAAKVGARFQTANELGEALTKIVNATTKSGVGAVRVPVHSDRPPPPAQSVAPAGTQMHVAPAVTSSTSSTSNATSTPSGAAADPFSSTREATGAMQPVPLQRNRVGWIVGAIALLVFVGAIVMLTRGPSTPTPTEAAPSSNAPKTTATPSETSNTTPPASAAVLPVLPPPTATATNHTVQKPAYIKPGLSKTITAPTVTAPSPTATTTATPTPTTTATPKKPVDKGEIL
jgi:serine/threonine-protein kinase